MFTTSLTAAVVAGLFASGSIAGLPEWSDSYGKAMTQAGERKKPVAVFLAAGNLDTLTNGKPLGTDALKSLKSDYIAVRVDTTTEDGKKMAAAFGMSQGVVLSDRTGKQIALKHQGTATPEQVTEYLAKFASVESASVTEHHLTSVPGGQSATVQSYQQFAYQSGVYQQAQYEQPRPVMNAIQNVGGAIQNVGGMMLSPFAGGS